MHVIDQISLRSIVKNFKQPGKALTVLDDVTLTFYQGQTYAIRGVSGSGKSTLMHIAAGFEKPTHGTVLWGEHDLAHIPKKSKQLLYTSSLGFVFQHHYLVAELTVAQNIMLPGMLSGMSTSACRQRAGELLDWVGLSDKADQFPAYLSGGQQQRLSLARALFNKPRILFADEPTGNLDADNAQRMADLMLLGVHDWGMGLVVCTHDEQIAGMMGTQLLLENCKLQRMS